MPNLSKFLADVTLSFAGLMIIFWWVFAIGLPVLFWVLVRNVVKGRRALERIAAHLESAPAPNGRGVLGL
jgi:hypothetical protein